ncbi:hypothetical protein D9757_005574 [Collybiopsis confluens]|uniref:Xaa-Pro dipeptidyl-peptidase-like domain-containing protein n=1 Tax=Collybiopsis confluens TaxID=2823264 RepID=A0A8H5HSW0_9AGAR|nr:hypothetical protein D9757_011146 [Collybiopsis confluens]KAF5388874.1 hypothetical protein D9757_005574 [Collybiopsis confluens]
MARRFSRDCLRIPTASKDVFLHVWLYKPEGDGPFPVVIAGHGLSVTKEAGLGVFGEKWANEAAFASIIFDYRFFGESDGQPRNLAVYSKQLEDYKSVLRWVRERPNEFKNDKIVIMGSATSGINVVNLALNDPGLAGAMMHSPILDGYATITALPFNARLMFWATVDLIKEKLGLAPVFIRAVGRPGEFAFLTTPSSYPGFEQMFSQGSIPFSEAPNLLTPRVVYELLGASARPGLQLNQVLCKTLVVSARDDDCIPIQIARNLVAAAPEKVVYVELPCGHYDVMQGGKGFDDNVKAQISFLQSLLN